MRHRGRVEHPGGAQRDVAIELAGAFEVSAENERPLLTLLFCLRIPAGQAIEYGLVQLFRGLHQKVK
jgi:hypothetical protein